MKKERPIQIPKFNTNYYSVKQEFFTISVHEIWNIENMEKWKV